MGRRANLATDLEMGDVISPSHLLLTRRVAGAEAVVPAATGIAGWDAAVLGGCRLSVLHEGMHACMQAGLPGLPRCLPTCRQRS